MRARLALMSTEPEMRRISIAVRQLDAACKVYGAVFGAAFTVVTEGLGPEVRCAVHDPGGGRPQIELIEPVDPNSPVARFIRKKGEGVHHLTFHVPDLESTLERLGAAGGRVMRTPSYYLSPEGRPLREAFLHPKDALGVLFHFVEDR